MIPEDGSYEALKAAIETCPALPSYWQPVLTRRFESFMSGVCWLSVTEGSAHAKLVYIAYLDGHATDFEQAKRRVSEEARKWGGWLFDWNGAPGNETLFNFGIALPRLLDGASAKDWRTQ